jgi:hypothetical protein
MSHESLELHKSETTPLLGGTNPASFWSCVKKHKMKIAAGASLFNGALFFAVFEAGVKNIYQTFKIGGLGADIAMDIVGAGACLCYAMFFYKTLESLSLKPKNILEAILVLLAPFAASSYFSAGKEGAESLSIITQLAITIGVVLFLLRMVNCVDGSTKFTKRLDEVKSSGKKAWVEKNAVELARLTVTSIASLGYAASATDAVYNASTALIGTSPAAVGVSYAASALGAIGIFPMTFYWTHRGLKQLTLGGRADENGVITDPTDRYTFAGLPIVATIIIGTVGSATGTSGNVFGKLGLFATCVRLGSSAVYATCGATPGISTLLRGIFQKAPAPQQAIEVTSEDNEVQEKIPEINQLALAANL